jgi:hypothetical protein
MGNEGSDEEKTPVRVTESPTASSVVLLEDQSVRLPFHRLLLIYFGIGVALFVSFLDQTSVSTAAPVIGGDIGGSDR